jgi:hypothetical protein
MERSLDIAEGVDRAALRHIVKILTSEPQVLLSGHLGVRQRTAT